MATVPVVNAGVGDILSPTQVKTFLACPAKWMFHYLLGLKEPKTGSLALGTAFHSAIAANFRQKIETRQDLPFAEVLEVFGKSWEDGASAASYEQDENPQKLAATGVALVERYMKEAAPSIQPRAVELPVSGRIGGVPVSGFVDLLDIEGRIIDCKTAARRPSAVSHDYGLQLTSYTMLTPGASGQCRLDALTKTKAVQLIQLDYTVGPDERRYAEMIYPAAQDGMKSGLYLPHRASTLCSRRYCGYWRECEREFGGRVEE